MKHATPIKIDENTFQVFSPSCTISDIDIKALSRIAIEHPNGLFRVNLHASSNSTVHQMVIILKKNFFIPKHFQENGHVSYFLLQGKLEFNLYPDGQMVEKLFLCDNHIKFLRLTRRTCRSIQAKSEQSIFIETCEGPFERGNTIWVS